MNQRNIFSAPTGQPHIGRSYLPPPAQHSPEDDFWQRVLTDKGVNDLGHRLVPWVCLVLAVLLLLTLGGCGDDPKYRAADGEMLCSTGGEAFYVREGLGATAVVTRTPSADPLCKLKPAGATS